jgi:hypothetical protein
MTHLATEGAMRRAMETIGVLSSVHPGTIRMRVLE